MILKGPTLRAKDLCVFTLFPGMVADRCGGSYVPAYVVFIIFSFFAVAAIQYMYVLNIKRDRRD